MKFFSTTIIFVVERIFPHTLLQLCFNFWTTELKHNGNELSSQKLLHFNHILTKIELCSKYFHLWLIAYLTLWLKYANKIFLHPKDFLRKINFHTFNANVGGFIDVTALHPLHQSQP